MSSYPPPPPPPTGPQSSPTNIIGSGARRGARIVPITILTLAALVVIAYAVGVLLTRGKIPRDTSIGGVSVGGKTASQAKTILRDDLAAKTATTISVVADGVTSSIVPAQAGMTVDVDQSVDALGTTSMTPSSILHGFGKGSAHNLVVTVDETALGKAIAAIAAKVDRTVSEGSIHYDGVTPVAVYPTVGRTLDQAASVALVEARFRALSGAGAPIQLPVSFVQPTSSQAQIEAGLTQLAAPAVSGPLHLTYNGTTVDVPPKTLAGVLTIAAGPNGSLTATADEAKVAATFIPLLGTLPAVTPTDAKIALVNGVPHITPSISSIAPDPVGLTKAIPAAVVSATRTVAVPGIATDPAFTTADAKKLGINQIVGEFATPHHCCEPRVHNITLAAATINGTIVLPGAQFSLNQALGERTAAKGYVSAPELEEGKDQPGIGGGVSQLSTTVFNATFFAGMEEITHKPHTFWISRYPQGREATVSWPQPQMIWQNNTPYGVLVQAWDDGVSTHVAIWSTPYWTVTNGTSGPTKLVPFPTTYLAPGETVQQCQLAGLGGENGFSISIWRKLSLNGVVKETDNWFWTYASQPDHICTPNPTLSPSPGVKGSPGVTKTPTTGGGKSTSPSPPATPSPTPGNKPATTPSPTPTA